MDDDLIRAALYPKMPDEFKGKEIRLPAEFRSVVANKDYEDAEIGRILRCLLLNSDVFIDSKIAGVVRYYREIEKKKAYMRKAVKKSRSKKLSTSIVDNSETIVDNFEIIVDNSARKAEQVDITRNGVETGVELVAEPLIPIEKTPSNPQEKTPPIVPLKKKIPSFLEKNPKLEVQGDLFESMPEPACTETGHGSPQALPDVSDVKTSVQDIERDPGPAEEASETMRTKPTGYDSRSDAAWIPQKFAQFWARYPRKVAKKDALKAFTKAVKAQKDVGRFMNTLLASIEWWKTQDGWKKDGGKFIPYPATWLNRGSWEDSMENGSSGGLAEFLARSEESDEELIRRMTGG